MVASLSKPGISMNHLEFGQSKEIYNPSNFPSIPTPYILPGPVCKAGSFLVASPLLSPLCKLSHLALRARS